MKYKFYTTSESAWTGMLDEIRSAKKSIFLECYIFLNDTFPTHDFFSALVDKAKQGVMVKMIIDAFGSYDMTDQDVWTLRNAGVEILFFDFWFRRLHRKVLIVDEAAVFFGGVNVGEDYRKWLDLQVRMEGPVVRSFLRSFSHTYHMCGGKSEYLRLLRAKSKIEKVRHWFIEHWPIHGGYQFKRYYKKRLNSAKRSITFVSPYFFPHRWMVNSLVKALRRGVKVEVILPLDNSPKIATIANKCVAAELSKQGIVFHFIPGVLHAKALLIDNEEGLIGSQNIDAQSFDFNVEAGVFFREPEMITDLKAIIDDWRIHSVVYPGVGDKLPWYYYFIYLLSKLLRRFI